MELAELKKEILENLLQPEFMIFKCEDDFFIAEQYIKVFSEKKNLAINYINSLESASLENFIFDTDIENRLNIFKIETFSDYSDDYSSYKNCIILCNKIDKKIVDATKDFVINFPKPEEWQIVDYIKTVCNFLDDSEATWLCHAAKNNMYRIENETDKIRLFSKEEQKNILSYMRFSPDTDLYNISNFDLSDWILKLDYRSIFEFLIHEKAVDIEPVGFINMMITQFKKILFVNYSNVPASELGISDKAYYFIKYNQKQSEKYLINGIKFLTETDCKIRSGVLDVSKRDLLDYTICKLLSLA